MALCGPAGSRCIKGDADLESAKPKIAHGTRDKEARVLQPLSELSSTCVELSRSKWDTDSWWANSNLMSRMAAQLRSVSSNHVARAAALDLIEKAFSNGDDLVHRLFSVVECEVNALSHSGSMVELLSVLVNLVPSGFKLNSNAEVTRRLLTLMLSGLAFQLQHGSAYMKKLKPLRNVLLAEPLCHSVPACLVSVIESHIHGPSRSSSISGEPCSSLGYRKPEPPTNDWLWATGNFTTEVLEILDKLEPFGMAGEQKEVTALQSLQMEMMEIMTSRTQDAIQVKGPDHCPPLQASRPKGLADDTSDTATVLNTMHNDLGSDSIMIFMEILIDMAGGAEMCVTNLVAMVEAEVGRLLACSQRSSDARHWTSHTLPLSVQKGKKKLLAISYMINAAFTLDGIDKEVLGARVMPALLRCVLQGIDLPVAVRTFVRPLLDLVLHETIVRQAAASLWQIVSDFRVGQHPKSAAMIYAWGCLSCEISDVLEPLLGKHRHRREESGAASTEKLLQSMRAAQWICDGGLRSLERSTPGGISLPAHCAPMTPPLGEAPRPKKRGRPSQRVPADSVHAPSSSTKRPVGRTSCGAHSDSSDWDESEDINTTSSESEGQVDDGSDLVDFIDLSRASNPYGLMQSNPSSGATPAFSSAATTNKVQTFTAADLVDDYEDLCEAHIEPLLTGMPSPSNPALGMAETSPNKRQRLAV